jgi:SAM-dependent methyltransferase
VDADTTKEQYAEYHEDITGKRYRSPLPVRRHAHMSRVLCLAGHLQPGQEVLEVGCGDGFFTVLAARRGARVTAVDISEGNLAAARAHANANDIHDVVFKVADAEDLPFPDGSFDVVVASHVIEHVPDRARALRELHRVCRGTAIVAVPTPLNLCSMIILGGGVFWTLTPRGLMALPRGALRVIRAWISREPGVDEGRYCGLDVPHVWFFPRAMSADLRAAGFSDIRCEPDSLVLPYLAGLLPLVRALERHRTSPLLRYFGYGSHFVCRKESGA